MNLELRLNRYNQCSSRDILLTHLHLIIGAAKLSGYRLGSVPIAIRALRTCNVASSAKRHTKPYLDELTPETYLYKIRECTYPMHHLLLFLPLLALILFFYYPWRVALPVYLAILIGSFIVYWKAIQAQRRPAAMGATAMVGSHARVVKAEAGLIEVEYEGEIWRAVCSQPVLVDQTVRIDGVEGLTLRVAPLVRNDA